MSEDPSDLLYGIVEYINDAPILDGMPYFKTMDEAIVYAEKRSITAKQHYIDMRHTIIRLVKAE